MADAIAELERGRESYAAGAWRDAYESLSGVDRASTLAPADLELLARAAYMLGRDEDYANNLQRAHRAHLDADNPLPAVRCGFWIGHNLLFRGEEVKASGWFARAERLLETAKQDSVERVWLARDEQARALMRQGDVQDGLRLVDEVLVAALEGELSPVTTGIVYCNTIAFCQEAYELRHAREWTEALTRWCERQPEMVAHNGLCLVHRAEIMQLQGAWSAALDEARRAAERFTEGVLNQLACGKALYREGELLRLRGELSAAEAAYRKASRCGHEPQPGLSLLRLGQGQAETAAAGIRRAVGETTQPLKRAALLPAYVEIMLAVAEHDRARAGCDELEEIAERQGSDALRAMWAHARGALMLAEGDARGALLELRRSAELWQALGARYEAARARMLVGRACEALGDVDATALETEAASEIFAELGAAPDLAHTASLVHDVAPVEPHGLTGRELEVLRLAATGKSNREIAEMLVISEHTVARHLQNLFVKLGVTSRSAATAFAYEHGLA